MSVREARHLVCRALEAWDLGVHADAVALCASELVANAVLHGRSPFDVVVRRLDGGGVRIDVIDERPTEVPIPVPVTGSAADITRRAATGRGLQLVAATATRWGYTTSEHDKAVWVEVTGAPPPEPTGPVVAGSGPPLEGGVDLDLRGMPVRAAVASGMQVDELVRWMQLGDAAGRADLRELGVLLDESAPARLAGRLAALRAAGRDERQFDLRVAVPRASLEALGRLNARLVALAADPAALTVVAPEVAAFRQWLQDETARQLHGEPPRPCPLPR